MAQNSLIYKVELSVSDMDRHYYDTHKLTVAKHPSETDERLMVRLLAFALNAHEHLEMTKGLSTDDEPDIWQKSLSDEIDVWVALGLPSEKIIRQSCNKSARVVIYPYGGKTAEVWWDRSAAAPPVSTSSRSSIWQSMTPWRWQSWPAAR